MDFVSHDLDPDREFTEILYEERPVLDNAGSVVEGLHTVWITLDNPEQLNSYTTESVKDLILAFRRASVDRAAVAVVFTGVGDRAFCTGGNTEEYSEYYAGQPNEYRQYMRLFNDMVSAILACDKPVINRVNGMRIGGGQEIGMACDFTLAADLARFGQAGPKHGSAPDGGSTDFLHLYVGWSEAVASCVLCEPWSAHQALRLGLVNDVFPVLRVEGEFVPNPLVVTDRFLDQWGRIVHGESKSGEDLEAGKALLKSGTVDFELLDRGIDAVVTKLLYTMPDCTLKTLESLRKKKLEHWDQNRETNRAWLSLNMMTEARAGFQAFHRGSREVGREVDFVDLRCRLAGGEQWGDDLVRAVSPQFKTGS
ncbi:MAG: 6-oxocyclohex-1-ene-1-carbonyl-CoA hydratase [Acidimicrobiaceae bacterium]|jgi:6-oxo-cyclohex-1-ene-carbonyl-CoA hydrolase|nr:6-oxocyclohex-1-ene-1-carbonyl-CoA hydratase [Acidimicrobiaceae bacterium]MDP7598176.1 6-oxocyclohex-1-ene-1-carbonyl-CoA hydratase [Acidimicrobiales bacterium]|tara:strand:- start:1178 stop:2278 length:1101 start_codon:yes stop_codon:yes gene_type:complete